MGVVAAGGAAGAAVGATRAARWRARSEAIAANPDVSQKVRDGKVAAAGALVGAVMKAMRGQANAATVNRLVIERLGSPASS